MSLKWMRFAFSFLLVSSLSAVIFSCGSSSDTSAPLGEWYKESDFDGSLRSSAVLFTIDGVPYLGSGFNIPQNTTNGTFLSDFYVFEQERKTWTKIKSLDTIPDLINGGNIIVKPRSGAVAFSAGGKGYVGLGSNGDTYFRDFYEYNPSANTWTKIADFPGSARFGAIAFDLNNKGYVGSGYDGSNYLKDMYSYDPAAGQWTAIASIGGSKRQNAFTFTIDGTVYVGGGSNNGALEQTMWAYDASKDVWIEKNDLQDDNIDTDLNDSGYTIARENCVTFVLNGKGYVVGGIRGGSINGEVWEYNPSTDNWIKKNAFEGGLRYSAVGYTLGTGATMRGYVATGRSGNLRLDDIWSFDPNAIDVN